MIFEKPRQTAVISFSNVSSVREYAVTECADRDTAELLVRTRAPLLDTVNGVARFMESIELKEFGGGCWDATVKYAKNPNRVEMNFDIGSGSTKALQSKETMAVYFEGGMVTGEEISEGIGVDIPIFDGGIGWNGTTFDGVDVQIPKMEFTINIKLQMSILPASYLITLFAMAQTVNDDQWEFAWQGQSLIFPKGSLRYLGSRIKIDSDNNLDVTYSFIYSKGITESDAITIGGVGPIEKEGHDYLWVLREKATAGSYVVKSPVGVYIERVYDPSNFNNLLLG